MTVYIIFKNSDLTEGRGPMVLDSVWLNENKAITYMNTKTGVMGRSGTYNNHVTGHKGKGWHDKISWPYGGDWIIKSVETED